MAPARPARGQETDTRMTDQERDPEAELPHHEGDQEHGHDEPHGVHDHADLREERLGAAAALERQRARHDVVEKPAVVADDEHGAVIIGDHLLEQVEGQLARQRLALLLERPGAKNMEMKVRYVPQARERPQQMQVPLHRVDASLQLRSLATEHLQIPRKRAFGIRRAYMNVVEPGQLPVLDELEANATRMAARAERGGHHCACGPWWHPPAATPPRHSRCPQNVPPEQRFPTNGSDDRTCAANRRKCAPLPTPAYDWPGKARAPTAG